mmetsp:Transcript_31786/g.49731  ORF Transcript_31786/g.49731 Transcript_31786/m.49731 type:complete len:192 (-) Transcript_31786:5-580(-)
MSNVSANATSVNPALRSALFQVNTIYEGALQYLRDQLPDSGSGYNHHSRSEPDWENTLWGANLDRLKELKQALDPQGVFNCWHCIGWSPVDPAENIVVDPQDYPLALRGVDHEKNTNAPSKAELCPAADTTSAPETSTPNPETTTSPPQSSCGSSWRKPGAGPVLGPIFTDCRVLLIQISTLFILLLGFGV